METPAKIQVQPSAKKGKVYEKEFFKTFVLNLKVYRKIVNSIQKYSLKTKQKS